MAVASTTQWNVMGAGSDNYGGGFDPAISGGADASQSTTPLATFNGTTVTATNAAAGATITLTGYTVLVTDAGNIVNITGGTHFVTGRFEITSVSTINNTWTLDRNCTSAAGTGMTGYAGGSLANPGTAIGLLATGQTVWIQYSATPYAITAVIEITVGGVSIYGYETTHGDRALAPTIQAASGSNYALIYNPGSNGVNLGNIILDANNIASGRALNMSGYGCFMEYLYLLNSTNYAAYIGQTNVMFKCVASGSVNGISVDTNSIAIGCIVNDCSVQGWEIRNNCTLVECIGANTTSGNNFSVLGTQSQVRFINCVSYGATGLSGHTDGFGFYAATGCTNLAFINCISYGNVFQGFTTSSAAGSGFQFLNCAAGGNGGANNDTGALVNENFVTLTANPFNNASALDFSLNDVAGGGAACRQAGVMGTFLGGTPVAYRDIGLQSLPITGGGSFNLVAGGAPTYIE